ncbi:MAG TPA: universal stress protein [Methylomirabilota bacterium]|jgi:nucleotide-binding universal stress UspA family protein
MFTRIVCATDFSDTAEAAWDLAIELARTHQAALVLVHVFSEMPVYPEVAVASIQSVWQEQRQWAEEQLAGRVEAAAARGLPARYLLRAGSAPEEIVQAAGDESADLVVVGTHGRTGINRLVIGSVAERVVRVAPCPVLTVKPRPAPQSARAAA